MSLYFTLLRLIHIFGGILWAGWAFILPAFIEPASKGAGPEGGKFMQALASKTKILPAMTIAPLLVILSGVLMYWPLSGGLNGQWLVSPRGLWLTLGALAGILAFFFGFAVNRPTAQRIATLSREIATADGPPRPEQLADLQRQQERLSKAGVVSAVLLGVTVLGMVLA
ncbi:MAG: hypothetical protein Kow0063_10990 [Anaerolineae bacterium]